MVNFLMTKNAVQHFSMSIFRKTVLQTVINRFCTLASSNTEAVLNTARTKHFVCVGVALDAHGDDQRKSAMSK